MYITKSNGDNFTGDFKAGKRDGEGVLKFGSKPGEQKTFTGIFKADKMVYGELKSIDAESC